LNFPFFLVRALVYFGGWLGIAFLLNKWSRQQDAGDLAVNSKLQRLSGAGLVFYALAVTAAGIDWIMSVEPALVLDDLRVPDDGWAGAGGAGVHDPRVLVPLQTRADVRSPQAASLP
jgi:hypothetical protein